MSYREIVTTYFGKLKSLPPNFVPISICGRPPRWYQGLRYGILAPSYSIVTKWKETHNNDEFTNYYYRETLGHLDPVSVVKQISTMTRGKDIALVCYERPDCFCHRHIVADWLNKAGFNVKEFKY